jgi:DNA polymerase-3 subunit beta
MKFSVASSELLKQLSKASGAIMTNPVIAILEDFLFILNGTELTICSSDLETTTIAHLDVQTEEEGSVAVPAKILLDTLRALPDQPVRFEAEPETYHIHLSSSYGTYTLAGHNPEDYPNIPELDDADTVKLPGEVLIRSFSRTLFATSNDELRLAMTGIFVQVDFNKVTFVSTDAHKLVKYQYFKVESDVTTSFILPKKSMSLLKGIIPGASEVEFAFSKTNAFFSFDGTRVICRLVDAKYPDYTAVIPVDNPNTLLVGRMDLLQSLRRISNFANKTTNQVVLGLTEDSLTISAEDLDFSNQANEQLSCSYEGEPMKIGFNARFLMEMLNVLDSEQVRLELDSPSRAGIMYPVEDVENEDILMLIMPVMLNY